MIVNQQVEHMKVGRFDPPSSSQNAVRQLFVFHPSDTPPISSIQAPGSCMLFRSRDCGRSGQRPEICRLPHTRAR